MVTRLRLILSGWRTGACGHHVGEPCGAPCGAPCSKILFLKGSRRVCWELLGSVKPASRKFWARPAKGFAQEKFYSSQVVSSICFCKLAWQFCISSPPVGKRECELTMSNNPAKKGNCSAQICASFAQASGPKTHSPCHRVKNTKHAVNGYTMCKQV